MPDYPTDRAGLDVLPFEECLRLLASVPVGRVGFVAEGEVVMLPVNHLARLRSFGLADKIGEDRLFLTLPTAVRAYEKWAGQHGPQPGSQSARGS